MDVFRGVCASTAGFRPLQLSHLELSRIDFLAQPILATYVDLKKLRTIQLSGCINIESALTSLASSLSITSALEALEIVSTSDTGGVTQAVEALLRSFSGLKDLWLDVMDTHIIDVSCLSRHGLTLRQLGLVPGPGAQRCLDIAALQTVISTCPNMVGLAVHFPIIDMGHIQTLGSDFEILQTNSFRRPLTELEAFLVCKSTVT